MRLKEFIQLQGGQIPFKYPALPLLIILVLFVGVVVRFGIQTVQPFLVPFVTLIGAISASFIAWRFGTIQAAIANQQAATASAAAATARKKLKFDLFEKRFKVYDDIRQFIFEFGRTPSVEAITKLTNDTRSAKWLFDSTLERWIGQDLIPCALEFLEYSTEVHQQPQNQPINVAEHIVQSVVATKLLAKFDELDNLCSTYLALEH